ncbi:MAG: PepSY-associated TM helix domain-containing protein [Myxococcota bacterium]
MTRRRSLQVWRALRWLHSVFGIATALVVAVVALSGTALAFRPEVESWLGPSIAWDASETASWQRVRDRAIEARPAHQLQMLWFPNRARPFYRAAYAFEGREYTASLSFHPATGERIDHEPSEFMPLMEELHENLLLGDTGAFLVRWSTALLPLLIVSGFAIGWPRRGMPRWLQIRAGKPWLLDVHRVAGVLATPLLLAMIWSGLVWAFPTTIEPWIYALTGEAPPEVEGELWQVESEPPGGDARDAAGSELMEAALASSPEGAFVDYLSFPIFPRENRQVRVQRGYAPWPSGERSVFYFDRYSGSLLGSNAPTAGPASRYLTSWNTALHLGSFGGLATRTLWSVASAALVFLALTGPWLWWRRRPRRTKRRDPA